MLAQRIGLRVIMSGLLVLFILTACGNNQSKVDDDKSTIMAEVEFLLKMKTLDQPKDESSIKFIRDMSEFLENENEKESFLEIADLLEQEDYDQVEKIFKELGGELIVPSATPSEDEVSSAKADQKFASLSLEAAELYIDATVDLKKRHFNRDFRFDS